MELEQEGFAEAVELNDYWRVVSYLEAGQVDPNAPLWDQTTALHVTVENGYVQLLELLVADNRIDLNVTDSRHETPTIIACRNEHEAILALLLKNQADVNISNSSLQAPLHLALRQTNHQLFRALMSAENIDLNICDSFGNTPLSIAIDTGNKKAVLDLLQRGADPHALRPMSKDLFFEAILTCNQEKNLPMISFLLHFGADLKKQDPVTGYSCLHFAVISGSRSTVEFLLQHGADPTIPDINGRSPLEMAKEHRLNLFPSIWHEVA